MAPIVALFALGVSAAAPFVLTTIGLVLTIAGPLLVSNRLAQPNYDVMLAWDPDAMPESWQATRTSYFALNWIRAVTSTSSTTRSGRRERYRSAADRRRGAEGRAGA